MTKNDLTEIIRKIVAEEVRNQFPALLAEILNARKPVIRQESIKPKPVSPPAPVTPSRPRVQVLTGNPKLDAILKETTGGFAGVTYEGPNVDIDGGFGFIGEGIEVPETSQYVEEIPSTVSLKHDLFQKDFSTILKKSSQMKSKTGPL